MRLNTYQRIDKKRCNDMTKERGEVYKCQICGNIVQLMVSGGGTLVCCGKDMELLKEKTDDQGGEKHVPVIEKTSSLVKVKVGSIPHPMEDKHFIQWIELIADDRRFIKFLKPQEKPEAEFSVAAKNVSVREYCNMHGLWRSK
jgi:superoxide reductase